MLVISDSICIKVLSSCEVLIATGNNLTYKHQSKKVNYSIECPIKTYDKIHRITFKTISNGGYQIIFAAGRAVVFAQIIDGQFQNIFESHMSDWICSINIHNDSEFSFLTKHNVAVLTSIDLANKSLKVIKKSRLLDKSTLYSSLLSGNCWDKTVIFSGTALGELLVWSPVECPGTVLSRKMAHNGVIFSIDLKMKVLTTTSDDRSLKYWSFEKSLDGQGYKIEEKKSFFGHTARIFCCKIIEHNGRELIISGGEDGTVCVWELTGNMVWKKKSCSGATIWCIDYDAVTQSIYVSTSNGNVYRYQFRIDLVEEKEFKIADAKTVVKFKYFNGGKVIMFQDYSVDLFKGTKKVNEFQLDTCNLMKTHKNLVVLASKRTLFLIQVAETDCKMEKFDLKGNFQDSSTTQTQFSMIRAIHFFHENEILICTNNGLCMVFSLREMTVQNVKYLLPLCTERFTTAVFKHSEFTVLGDRCGHLHLYLTSEEIEGKNSALSPVHTLRSLHGHLGVTNILLDYVTNDFIVFLTTGHDGTMKTLAIDIKLKQLIYWNTEKVPIIWIEKVVKHDDNTYVFGFNSNYFVGYRLKSSNIMFEYKCGGGHRDWDINVHDNKVIFTYIQRGQLKTKQFEIETNPSLRMPYIDWHIEACNLMKPVQAPPNQRYFLSAGEDNLMKVLKLNTDCSLEVVKNCYQHISTVKTFLALETKNNDTETIIISAGGRSQICINKLTICAGGHVQLKEEFNFMLLSTDSERKRKGIAQQVNFDPETRFMCLDLDLENLYVGCSDGFVRIFTVICDEQSGRYKIAAKDDFFYGRCILNLKLIKTDCGPVLLTMSTDGLINFWNGRQFGKDSKPFYALKHHNSGVNCFDVLQIGNTFIVASGGDDQQISVSHFSINSMEVNLGKTQSSNSLHSAQVTAIKIKDEQHLIASSVDQTVSSVNLDDLSLRQRFFSCIADIKGLILLDNIENKDSILVYGCGLQIINNK